jgi:hypothetical protein
MPHAYLYRCDLTGSKNLRGIVDIVKDEDNYLLLIILLSKLFFN